MSLSDMNQKTIFDPWDVTKEQIWDVPQLMCDMKQRRFIVPAKEFLYVECNLISGRSHVVKAQPPKPLIIPLRTPNGMLVFHVPYLQMCKILIQRFAEQKVGVPKRDENWKISVYFDYPALQHYRAR